MGFIWLDNFCEISAISTFVILQTNHIDSQMDRPYGHFGKMFLYDIVLKKIPYSDCRPTILVTIWGQKETLMVLYGTAIWGFLVSSEVGTKTENGE